MGNTSGKNKSLYKQFKEEAIFVTMKSTTAKKRCIKWRGKIFLTGSMIQVFNKIKNEYE